MTKKSAHILLLDDQPDTVAPAIGYLALAGYRVSATTSIEEAKTAIELGDVDLAILDVNLGKEPSNLSEDVNADEAGFAVAAWSRRHHPHVGVIIYSDHRTDADSQVEGLRQGADDYIIKTDSYDLFIARVSSVLRRRRLVDGASATFDGYEIDLGRKRAVLVTGESIELTDAEFRVLEALVMNSRRNLSREELYEAAFRHEMPTRYDRAVDNLIAKLRKKLQINDESSKLIQSIRGEGYRLEATVSFKW